MHFINKSLYNKDLHKKNSMKKYFKDNSFFKNLSKEKDIKLLAIVASIIILVSFITVYVGAEMVQLPIRNVVLNDNGSVVYFKSRSGNIGEFLRNNNIGLREEDIISPCKDTELIASTKNEIFIQRAIPIKINVDGQEILVYTQKRTVAEVLEEKNIMLNKDDQLMELNLESIIYSNLDIRILRIKEDILIEKESIAFKTVKKPNQRLEQGVEKVAKQGVEGVKEYSYKVIYEDGEIRSKELVKETIACAPVDKIIEYGTITSKITSRGDSFRYKQALDMRSTAYTASFQDTGKSPGHPQFGITYTGVKAKRGIIAVDPRVIPLGTRVYVEGVGNTPDYGYAVAADIGGAIKGNIIDIYLDSQPEVTNWGVRKVKVYILSD